MPFIRISILAPKLSADQIRQLQLGTTELMVSGMRKPIQGTAVLVERIGEGGWSIAANAATVAAHVEATIGLGSNTPSEKAHFMGAMMKLLRSVLGEELRDETYIVFHEVKTDTYGRGGLTRAERDRQSNVQYV